MTNKIVFTKYNEKYIVAFIKNDTPIKIRCIDSLDSNVDEVYLARVTSVKNNISSSFVKYAGNIGYIGNCNRKPETVFPVMLKKETAGTKENEVTDIISLKGLYVIVSNGIKGLKYSSKINSSTKEKLSSLDINNALLRTNAINADLKSIQNEFKYLSSILDRINSIKDKRTENTILYEGLSKFLYYIFSEDLSEYDEVVTDVLEIYNLIDSYFSKYKNIGVNIPIHLRLYDDSLPLKALISLSTKMDRATERKVYLKSDAYIVIDYTEALTVIDVNSGNTTHKGNKADVIHSINLEACDEIALQLKLRNLSGIIIVDFINEKNAENNEQLLSYLKKLLKTDDCHARVHSMTKLNLVEITRDRTEKTLREQLWK